MGRRFHRALVPVLLTAVCMLTACAAKPPPAATADASQPSLPSPQAPEGEAPEQQTEPLSNEALKLPVHEERTTRFVSDPSVRRLLRWKFAVGDVIRYETSFVEKLSLADQEFRNERLVRFRWTVLDVYNDGTASIQIAFDRVRLNLEHPPFSYDSDNEPPDVNLDAEENVKRELKAVRNLLGWEGVMEVNLRGEGTLVQGGETVHEVWQVSHFATADFSTLPKEPVGPDDSWRVPVAEGEIVPQCSGYADCRLKSDQPVGGRRVTVIEGRATMTPIETPALAIGQLQPLASSIVSRFDGTSGRFLSRTTMGQVTTKDGAGREIRKSFEVKHQLLPDASDKGKSLQALVESRYSHMNAAVTERSPSKRRGPVER
jgi:hypothetical protein